jgi:single-stranded-DNA-specific exonuclease
MEAARIAVLLDKLNRERKAVEAQMLEEAVADRLVDGDLDLPVLIVGSECWHKGVVGLVTSRLVERFGRPARVIAWDGSGVGTGSLRSVAGVDIGAAVRAAMSEGLLVKGGGHAMAAGLTVAQTSFDAFRAAFSAMLREPAGIARADRPGARRRAHARGRQRRADRSAGEGRPLRPGQSVAALCLSRAPRQVRQARRGNAYPVRARSGRRRPPRRRRIPRRGTPLGDLLLSSAGLPLHVAGTLRRDAWGGRQRIELQIEDAADPRRQS